MQRARPVSPESSWQLWAPRCPHLRCFGQFRLRHPLNVGLRVAAREVVWLVSLETLAILGSEMPRKRWSNRSRMRRPRNSGLGDTAREVVQPFSYETCSQLWAARCLAREVVQRVPLEILATVGSALPHAMWSGQFRLRHSSQPWVRRCLARGGPASFASGVARAARRHTRELTPNVPARLRRTLPCPRCAPTLIISEGQ